MQSNELTSKLMNFGLTRQEAMIYQQLVVSGECTGYEVAKEVGISRSNAYSSLTSLVDKGAVYLQSGNTNKYMAVEVSEFCGNKIRSLENDKNDLENNLKVKEDAEGYDLRLFWKAFQKICVSHIFDYYGDKFFLFIYMFS